MRHFVILSPVLSDFRRGEVVAGDRLASDDEGLDRTVARGWVREVFGEFVEVDEDEETASTADADWRGMEAADPNGAVERPALNARRSDWAAYAEAHGVDPGDRSRDEIAALFSED